jgi:predicted  nucleic acid-binding Zn-ribbon protein
MEGDELYGDLEDITRSIEYERLKSEFENLNKKIQSFEQENDDLKKQIEALLVDKKILEQNVIAIYNTAIKEVDRKDREILELKRFKISHELNKKSMEF